MSRRSTTSYGSQKMMDGGDAVGTNGYPMIQVVQM